MTPGEHMAKGSSLLLLSLLLTITGVHAQNRPDSLDSPRFYRNESQVFFSRRIWRVIDLRETQNRIVARPENPIQKILYEAVLNGILKPYLTDSLASTIPLSRFTKLGNDTFLRTTPVDPANPTITKVDTVVELFEPYRKVVKLLIMEDWVFDKKNSKSVKRIIAIAPLYQSIRYNEETGPIPLCWLRYDGKGREEAMCRDILKKEMIYDRSGQAAMSYAEWFEKRFFHSYIIKQSNNRDYSISMHPEFRDNGTDALLESQKILDQLNEEEENKFED